MILVVNTGSSSIKMALLDMPSESILALGTAERIGEGQSFVNWHISDHHIHTDLGRVDHETAMPKMLTQLFAHMDKSRITAVGHRIVHGGERFTAPTRLDAAVIAEIESISYLAPLHNPANLLGVSIAMRQLPEIPHIAVFDTSFHHTMPLRASLYAVPYDWYRDHGVRRYGFHGTSHHYVALEACKVLGLDFDRCRLITAHLGNGCSASAIADGQSIDTTMGLTPLEGLVMGTRSGDVDPGLHDFIARQTGLSLNEITEILNRQSGLLGLSGQSNDMRTLLKAAEDGNTQAELAVEIFCYRLAKSLAALAVSLGRVDAIIFTGGIGEHACEVRARVLSQLGILGTQVDKERNRQHGKASGSYISPDASPLPSLVIATSEETMIARYVHTLSHQSGAA